MLRLYRAYALDRGAFIGQPPSEIEAGSDDEAMQKVQVLFKTQDVELWESSRRVAMIQAQVILRR